MDNLPFGEYDYRKYENTFLTRAIVSFHIHSSLDSGQYDKNMNLFLKQEFNIDSSSKTLDSGIRVSSPDETISFGFKRDFANVEISCEKYNSFSDTVVPQVFKIKNFIEEVAHLDTVESLSIRKINLWRFEGEKSNDSLPKEVARELVFSNEFQHLETNVELSKEEEGIDNFMRHRWEDNNSILELRSAYMSHIEEKPQYALFLDIMEYVKPSGGIPIERIDSTLKDINRDLYNAYMWSVSSKIKNIMKTGKDD